MTHEAAAPEVVLPEVVLPRVVLLTDRSQLRLGRGLLPTVAACHRAGLEAVIVREHDLLPAARRALLAALTRLPGLTVISSRIAEPAAHAQHLSAEQQRPSGPTVWGRSCHSREEVARAAGEGAAWVTLSPYDVSASKPGHGPPLPGTAWADHPVPVLALGGVTPGNAAAARAAGAHGVAVMGEVMRAADPADVVARLLEAV